MQNTKLDINSLTPSSTFRGGEGLSKHHINCSANPYDLRPAADIIVGAARKMMNKLRKKDTPLVVLIGEDHTMPAHTALQQMVASRFLERDQQFTFNFEYPHNLWSTIVRTGIPELTYNSSSFDSDGKAVLSAFLGCANPFTAPVSKHNLAAFCYHNDIITAFNDAANGALECADADDEVVLDLNDPYTAALADEFLKNNGQECAGNIDAYSANGLAVRNLVMARRGLDHAKAFGNRLIIQNAGISHVFGNAFVKRPYETSLCEAYCKAGAAVLPVFITGKKDRYGLNIIPEAAYKELSGSVIIDGLSEEKFHDYDCGEKEFITEKLCKNSGGELSFFDAGAQTEKYRELTLANAKEMKDRAAANENAVLYQPLPFRR